MKLLSNELGGGGPNISAIQKDIEPDELNPNEVTTPSIFILFEAHETD